MPGSVCRTGWIHQDQYARIRTLGLKRWVGTPGLVCQGWCAGYAGMPVMPESMSALNQWFFSTCFISLLSVANLQDVPGCPKLHAPIGGHLDPEECGTALNDECTFWCDAGYCPYNGSEPECSQKKSLKLQTPKRVCLSTKQWSGPDFRCEVAQCVSPKNPENGLFECNLINFGRAVCTLKCNVGYKPEKYSSLRIICQVTGTWKNIEKTKCIPVQCNPYRVKNKITLKPKECGTNVQPFNQSCQLHCKTGYDYVGIKPNQISMRSLYGVRICDVNGWTGRERYTCKDVERPVITCPKSIKVSCPLDKKISDKVNWQIPVATDNDGLRPMVTLIYPPFAKNNISIKPPHRFPPGKNKLIYQAKDGVDLVSTCSFIIEVEDTKPPNVQYCPESIDHFTTSTSPITVDWKEPEFDDDSDIVRITYQSHQPKKDKFAPNQTHRIKYIATDDYNNSATCEFELRLNPYECLYKRPPLHGKLSCNKIQFGAGQECTVTCNKGFEHVEKPLPVYKCLVKLGIANWDPIDKTWPDCLSTGTVNICTPDSCFNNGICIDGIDDYSCKCAAGFEGPRCQDVVNNCQDGVCLNGGTCRDGVNNFTCKCLTGYAGEVCQFALDKCNSNPCYNHGQCINKKDGFLCGCKNGFSGAFCEIQDNYCINSNPCLHGSKCVEMSNNYKCDCSAGYSGINCEENIDECKSQPCLNHGNCSDGIDNFQCKCSPGFEGKTCETVLSSDFDVEFQAAKTSNYATVKTKEDLLNITVMFWIVRLWLYYMYY
uniref:Sushi, von Willebrand factor type A, EGF and pentraxin domain-containing protein 1 n=1 Tax=Strigamia maritima TaxID=126957 RepID=T1IH35_STRMM